MRPMVRERVRSAHEVVARAKAAIAAGDRDRALALLHAIAVRDEAANRDLTADVLEALVATAAAEREAADRATLALLARVQQARADAERLIRETPFDAQDLLVLRRALEAKERTVRAAARQRVQPQRAAPAGAGGTEMPVGTRGYLELKLIPKANGRVNGPYLYYRLKQGRHLRSRYLGKPPAGV